MRSWRKRLRAERLASELIERYHYAWNKHRK
jgi:hypothetical protein